MSESNTKTLVDPLHATPTLVSAAQNRPTLTVLSGIQIGRIFTLKPGVSTIGRAAEADVHIPHESISRTHCEITVHDTSGIFIRDLNSTNGTRVNGAEIGGQTLLKGGERLRLSTTVILKFALQDRLENEALETLYSDSVRDPLTGSYNKRFLMERIDHELVHASRHEGALSLMIFDLDHFKRVNDTFGHATGDAVLTETVERVRSALRAEDVLARYGGEEFVVLMRNTPLREALRIAERIRRTIEARTFLHDNNEIELTLSVGVAEFAHPVNPNASELIEMADAHLYRAKTLGRNRVEGA